jgi:hypothetical protein
MYLVLRPPWGHRVTRAADEPPVVVVPGDAGVSKTKPKHRRTRPPAAGQSDPEPEEIAPVVLTAADRALEWRGDDVALPARRIDERSEAMEGKGPRGVNMAGGDARPLDDGEIAAALASGGGGFKDCVVQGATGTDLRAAITVKLLVDARGQVTRSRVHAPRFLFEHGLLGCAQRAASRIRFPATGAATVVTVPINLG